MDLYIVRHAITEYRENFVGSDVERPLTSEGIEKTRKSMRGLCRLGCTVHQIISSPYARAHETALIAKERLKPEFGLLLTDALIPDATVEDFWHFFLTSYHGENIMLISHERNLQKLLQWMLSKDCTSSFQIELDTGSICLITLDSLTETPPSANLKWLLTADQLSQIKK